MDSFQSLAGNSDVATLKSSIWSMLLVMFQSLAGNSDVATAAKPQSLYQQISMFQSLAGNSDVATILCRFVCIAVLVFQSLAGNSDVATGRNSAFSAGIGGVSIPCREF